MPVGSDKSEAVWRSLPPSRSFHPRKGWMAGKWYVTADQAVFIAAVCAEARLVCRKVEKLRREKGDRAFHDLRYSIGRTRRLAAAGQWLAAGDLLDQSLTTAEALKCPDDILADLGSMKQAFAEAWHDGLFKPIPASMLPKKAAIRRGPDPTGEGWPRTMALAS